MTNRTNRNETKQISIKTRFICFFSALTLLLCAGIALSTYRINMAQISNQYAKIATNSIEMAASLIDGDSVARWLEYGRDEEYEQTCSKLKALKKNFGLQYLYVFVPDSDKNNTRYVFDIAIDGEDGSLIFTLGDESGEVDVYDTVCSVFQTGQTESNGVITKGEFGYLLSAYGPLFSPSDHDRVMAVIGVDINMSVVLASVRVQTVQIVTVGFCIILLFAVLIITLMNKQIIDPVKRLSHHMNTFVNGDEGIADTRITDIHTKDEIEQMAHSFNHMADNIVAYTNNLARVTADKERIATELNVATQIQTSMLPCTFPAFPERSEFDIYASMCPAKEVGGDFYDFFLVDDRHLAIVIADVSGKGVPAALFMVITRTLIKNQTLSGKGPAEVFTSVNNLLCENNGAGMFVTAFMGVLDLENGKFVYTNAGHNPPLIRKNGVFSWLKVRPGLFLAGMEGIKYRQYELTLAPSDLLFLYTDGVTEALNPAEELYGDNRLIQTLNRNSTLKPKELLACIRADIDEYADGAVQADDITMQAIAYIGSSSGIQTITVPAKLSSFDEALSLIDGILEAADCPTKQQAAIDVAFEELFVNIATYAYPQGEGCIEIHAGIVEEPKRMRFTMCDSGIPYDPLAHKDPDITASIEERSIGGLGIFMVKKTMDNIQYSYQDGKNILTVEKNL